MSTHHSCSAIGRCILIGTLLLLHLGSLNAYANNTPKPVANTAETIQINQTVYPVPAPWAGNRIITPSLPMRSFAMIPVDHAKNNTQLYVVKEAHTALVRLLQAAKDDGVILTIESGYRSPGFQRKIFSKMLTEGRTFDDIIRYVAPPGYSEHALGTAVDFYPSNWEFARLPAYEWLQENGSRYGFYETYPRNNKKNYPWEAWHWRFHGDVSNKVSQRNDTPPPQG